MRARALGLAALAGCGGAVVPAAPPTGCPPALAIARAVLTDDGYQVELGWRGAAAPDTPAPGAVPGYVIARLGLGPLPVALWIMRPDRPACAARIAGYHAEPLDDGVELLARLAGCDADDPAPVAWASLVGADPGACQVLAPVRRVDRQDGDAIADEVALPPPWDARVAPPCDGCTRRWTLDEIAGTPVVGALTVIDAAPEVDAEPAVDAAPAAGAAPPVIAAGVEPPPLTDTRGVALAGALADATGTRGVLLSGADRWEVLGVDADGRAGARRTVDTGPAAGATCPP
jgi:hypothetical protein